MKNLYDGSGLPLPIAKSDIKAEMKKLALLTYAQGIDAACDCMKTSFQTAIDKGHTELSFADGLVLIEELREIAKKNT
jgi:hypothetical protein